MRAGIGKTVLDYIAANPGAKRDQIIQACGINQVQASNILWRLKGDRLIECKFAGRFSTWDIVREKRPVNSVFNIVLGVE